MFKMLRRFKIKPLKKVDLKRRKFLVDSIKIISAIGAISSLFPFIASLSPNKKTLRENDTVKIDLSRLRPGEQMTSIWRGKPILIYHRTSRQIQELKKSNSNLRDPDSLTNQQPEYAKNIYRSRNPNYLVLVGLCTHLGCSPKLQNANENNKPAGFYCPCHDSRFDLAGRVYKNMPAPVNLEVPPYYFLNDNILVIGDIHEIY
jgi:ubiquinol-cytochrome c reductase iron-sulfur subunit